MFKSKCFRFLAAVLAVLLLVPGLCVTASDDDNVGGDDETDFKGIGGLTDVLSTISYSQYLSIYGSTAAGSGTVKPSVSDYDEESTSANGVKTYDNYEGVADAILLPADGFVGWKINVPSDGLYTVRLKYFPIDVDGSKNSSIERSFYIDGAIPYYEATYIKMTKVYTNNYVYGADGRSFTADINGNEIRPSSSRSPEWRECVFCDSTGYYVDPLQFYFSAGEHTIQLYAQREAVVIADIELYPYEKEISYADYLKKYNAESSIVTLEEPLRFEAEYTESTSENTIYPTNDRTSCITSPQHPSKQYLNTIGGGGSGGDKKWTSVGQWVRYKIEVPQTGFYKIALRYKQDEMQGSFVSRKLRVQLPGESYATLPFSEANYLEFNYADDWQSNYIFTAKTGDDGSNVVTELMVYFEKGTNYVEFEADLGRMSDIIRRVAEALSAINESYIKILMIAGTDPDNNRDYGFYTRIPDAINTLLYESAILYEIEDDIVEMTGEKGSHVATLETVARLLARMGSDEDEIASNLSSLKGNLGTLGTWISDSRKSPLELDFIELCSGEAPEKELPRATSNFFQSMWFEIRMFVASFGTDYNALGQIEKIDKVDSIEVWTTNARDQAQIIRNLVNNNFTPQYGISVNLKLVAGGSLLPSVLAGVGPDVSLGHGSGDVINWAIRNALTELSDLDGWNDILGYGENEKVDWNEVFNSTGRREGAWFDSAAIIPMMLNEVFWEEDVTDETGDKYIHYTEGDTKYAEKYSIWSLPMTQNFYMMFYRADVFLDLGIEAPKTWQDLISIMGVLMNNNMEVTMLTSLTGYQLFLYQLGGDLYTPGGMQINLDDNTSRTAFETLCTFFTQYKVPVTADFVNRFRTGEVPLGILDYSTYTQLSVYATEIQGLWEFIPLPGFEQPDGTVNNCSTSGVAGAIMLRGAQVDDKVNEAWTFMKWYCGAENQSNFANELTALLGVESKYNTANVLSLMELPWTTSEANNLRAQFDNLAGIPEYPGSYIISRYINFSFMDVINNNTDPSEALLEYLTSINSELARKRKEFGLAYKEVSYSN